LRGGMYHLERRRWERLLSAMMNLHPQQFEIFAGILLESLGFTDIEITNYVRDGGIYLTHNEPEPV